MVADYFLRHYGHRDRDLDLASADKYHTVVNIPIQTMPYPNARDIYLKALTAFVPTGYPHIVGSINSPLPVW